MDTVLPADPVAPFNAGPNFNRGMTLVPDVNAPSHGDLLPGSVVRCSPAAVDRITPLGNQTCSYARAGGREDVRISSSGDPGGMVEDGC